MLLSIDPHVATPPYEQIRIQIAALVRFGELPAGTRVPTVLRLARQASPLTRLPGLSGRSKVMESSKHGDATAL